MVALNTIPQEKQQAVALLHYGCVLIARPKTLSEFINASKGKVNFFLAESTLAATLTVVLWGTPLTCYGY